jgi:hypothetical protein
VIVNQIQPTNLGLDNWEFPIHLTFDFSLKDGKEGPDKSD